MLLWNRFIKQVTSGLDFYGSKIIILSFIRTPPTDYNTVFISPFEASERSKGHFQKTCFVTLDQPLFFKARDTVEGGQHSELSCVVVRLGEFHLLMSFMGCIGAIMAGSCLKALFIIYLFIQITGLDKMLNGHAYSRAIRAHILTNLILAGIILDEVDLTGKERAETENKLRESERSLILFVKKNRTYQSLRAKFKSALHNLEGNQSCGTNIFTRLLP
jgi:hypothetical protein